MSEYTPRLKFDDLSSELDQFLNRFNAGRSSANSGSTSGGSTTGSSRGDEYEEEDDPYSGRHSNHSGHSAPPVTTPVAPPGANPGSAMPPDKYNPVLHHARRLTFGPTPELVATIAAMGTAAWIDEQLAWQSIDESALEPLLASFPLALMTVAAATGTNPMLIISDMSAAALGRAVWGKRQLHEMLVDFWSNHFSIDVNVKTVRAYAPIADQQVIRANSTGRFADMLLASAKSPAMLNFLDNFKSRADGTHVPNENYARELMELHTVGVDGGYDETDVKEVAALLSGWTVSRLTNTFIFDPRMHDYVAPTDPIVATVAAAYLANDTAIAPTVRTLLLSTDFQDSARLKARRPFEFVAGTLREVQVSFTPAAAPALRSIATTTLTGLGQQLFGWPLPNGYADSDIKWISAGGMLDRWRFAQQVATNAFVGLTVDTAGLVGNPAPVTVSGLINSIATGTIGENLDLTTLIAVLTSLGMDGDMRWPSWYDPTPILAAVLQSPQNQIR